MIVFCEFDDTISVKVEAQLKILITSSIIRIIAKYQHSCNCNLKHHSCNCNLKHLSCNCNLKHHSCNCNLKHHSCNCNLKHHSCNCNLKHHSCNCNLKHLSCNCNLKHLSCNCNLKHHSCNCNLKHLSKFQRTKLYKPIEHIVKHGSLRIILEPEILGNHNINTGTTLLLKTIVN